MNNPGISIAMDSDEFSVNGNTEGNRHNGGWVAEQGDWNYYGISGCIYKENVVTNEKYAIFDSMSNTGNIFLQVMGEWIYFEIEDNLYRISVDGSTGSQFTPDLGNDVIFDWDVYNGNVYIIVRENLSASTYNYYLAITDWNTQSYQKILNIGNMHPQFDDFATGDVSHFIMDYNENYLYLHRDAFYFIGIDEGYAYFIYTSPESHLEDSSFTAYKINLDNIEDKDIISWKNDKKLPYCSIHVSNNCVYAFSTYSEGFPDDNYYDIIDFNNNTVSTCWIPELGDMIPTRINISPLGILKGNPSQLICIVDNNVINISEDSASNICTAHNKIYYYCNNLYCQINPDDTGWESIDLDSFIWIDETLVFE